MSLLHCKMAMFGNASCFVILATSVYILQGAVVTVLSASVWIIEILLVLSAVAGGPFVSFRSECKESGQNLAQNWKALFRLYRARGTNGRGPRSLNGGYLAPISSRTELIRIWSPVFVLGQNTDSEVAPSSMCNCLSNISPRAPMKSLSLFCRIIFFFIYVFVGLVKRL